MQISLQWLKEYVDLPVELTMEELAYDLTMRTVEVEGVVYPAKALDQVVVGKILEVNEHPDADKLRVCKVDVGEEVQIVCGGKNLCVDQLVAVALPGSFVRWHGEGEPVEIKASKLRGVDSFGMICASDELQLEDLFPAADESEIIDLTNLNVEAGRPLAEALNINDAVLEIDNKSMTNRPDLWGHYGIARELSAIYQVGLKPLPAFELPEKKSLPIEIEDGDKCYRYAALEVHGVTVKPSPYWLKARLQSVGIRPINNIVDLTNYVMLTTGQPMHGFDLNHIDTGIIVRRAKEGEKLVLLTEEEVHLTENDLLIADHKNALALAGVMGGFHDSILPETKNVLFEFASFEPIGIRKTAKRLAQRTDASSRFEKGIDTQRIDDAIHLTIHLLQEMLPEAKTVAYSNETLATTQKKHVEIDESFLNDRLGQSLAAGDVVNSLGRLGFEVEHKEGVYFVEAPTWRSTGDIGLKEDIVEEVARLIGYENFSFIAPKVELCGAIKQPVVSMERKIREYLSFRCGMQEIFNYPWVKDASLEACGMEGEVRLEAAPAPDLKHLRPSIVPSMLDVIDENSAYFDSFKIFECAKVYHKGPKEEKNLCFAIVSEDALQCWKEAKGVIESFHRHVMSEPITFSQKERAPWCDSEVWLSLETKGDMIGHIGLLSKKTLKMAGIKHMNAAIVDLNVDSLLPLTARENEFQHLPVFPVVEKDLSVVFSEDITWQQIRSIVEPMVKELIFVDEYRGVQVGEGMKSITFRVHLANDQRTLEAKEIESKMNAISKRLDKELSGKVRSEGSV